MTTHKGTDAAAVAIYDDHSLADHAVKALGAAHFDITKVSVIGRGFHTEEQVAGFYNSRDRIRFWGKYGAFWGGLWGMLMGGIFMTIPFVGPVIVAGHLAVLVLATVEGAVVVGGLSAIGAALYGLGIPKDSVLHYEEAIKEDRFMVIVHGTANEVEQARGILQSTSPRRLDLHAGLNATPAPDAKHREVIGVS